MALPTKAYDFQNINTEIGETKVKVKKISFSTTVATEKIKAPGARKDVDFTDGVFSVEEITATFEFTEWKNFVGSVGPGFMRKKSMFDWSLVHSHDGMPTMTDKLIGCRCVGHSRDHEAGESPLEVEATFQALDFEEGGENGGIDPFAD